MPVIDDTDLKMLREQLEQAEGEADRLTAENKRLRQNDQLQMERAIRAEAENERLRALAKEVDGCWMLYSERLREIMGHTNYNVIARKLADLDEQKG